MNLPRDYARFEFTFSVIRESLAIDLEGLAPLDEISPNQFLLRGTLTTRDSQDGVAVKKILSARQEGKALAVDWAHENEGRSHSFVIRTIQRLEQPSRVEVKWDGSAVGAEQKGSRQVDVPSLGQFDLLEAEAVLEPATSILLRFSDPLKKNQNLRGLITIPGMSPPSRSTTTWSASIPPRASTARSTSASTPACATSTTAGWNSASRGRSPSSGCRRRCASSARASSCPTRTG